MSFSQRIDELGLPIDEIMKMLRDNILKRRAPLPMPDWAIAGWAEGIPRGGSTILYTGQMYQLVPYINATVHYLEDFEVSRGGRFLMKIGRIVSKVVDVTKFIASVKEENVKEVHEVLKKIANTLRSVGVEFGYLHEKEPYPGTLLYDLGMDEAFKEHADYVYKLLKEAEARTVITVDPHTTHVLRHVFPEYVDGFDLDVVNYLEILAEKGYKGKVKGGRFTIHDPCIYTRYEEVVEQPREILNVEVVEPEMARERTVCCGGPLEFCAPRFSGKVAKDRISQLKAASKDVITLCPICLGNLRRWGGEEVTVRDIATLL